MSMEVTKSYVNEFVAIVKGDDAEAKAERSFRSNVSALKTNISSMEGDSIDLEDMVSEAKENLRLARYNNGEVTTNRGEYVKALVNAKNQLTVAEEKLENHLETLNFLRSELEAIKSDKKK